MATAGVVHPPCRRAAAGLGVANHTRGRRMFAMQEVVVPPETRARTVRARLPGQMLQQRIENAQLTYGPLYTLAEVRKRVGDALPRRMGYVRSAVLEPIESYRHPISDEALLKYDDAIQSGIFDKLGRHPDVLSRASGRSVDHRRDRWRLRSLGSHRALGLT